MSPHLAEDLYKQAPKNINTKALSKLNLNMDHNHHSIEVTIAELSSLC